MANKNDKKSGLTKEDILTAVLTALAGAVGLFIVIMIGGLLLFPDSWQQTAAAPSTQATQRGTLPSTSPTTTQSPAPTTEPEETGEPTEQTAEPPAQATQALVQTQAPSVTQTVAPAQTQAPAPTPAPARAPTVPVQTPAPAVTIPPVQNTPAPTQAGNAGTTQNGDGTYTHDFSGGRVLATRESNNNNDPVYHTRDCRSAKRILPENELWYSSAQAAQNDGRRLCGNCG